MRERVDDETEGSQTIPTVGVLSRTTIDGAIERLQDLHGLADEDSGFAALQKASQTHNVKLRTVAAAVVAASGSSSPAPPRRRRPSLSFSTRGNDPQPNRTHVLHDLLHAAAELSGADYGAVQLRDPMHGGLIIEGQYGFDRDFLDFFSYIDDAGTACGTTVARCTQTFVDDVAASTIYSPDDRDIILRAGVRSALSTPLRGADCVVGVVTTHFCTAHRCPDETTAATIQRHADGCAQWLQWYDATAMPRIVSTVHSAARAAKANEAGRGVRRANVPTPAALRHTRQARPLRAGEASTTPSGNRSSSTA